MGKKRRLGKYTYHHVTNLVQIIAACCLLLIYCRSGVKSCNTLYSEQNFGMVANMRLVKSYFEHH